MMKDGVPSEIVRYPDPRLRERCKAVSEFDDGLRACVEQMLEMMKSGRGVGLAGPQVGLCYRLFVCNETGKPEDDQFYINPELSDLYGSEEMEEGCLSLPDVLVMVRRARRCKITAYDLSGKRFEREAVGLLARIWQHETDHLDGTLIIDRMNATDRIANKRAIVQLEMDYESVGQPSKRG